MIEDFIEPCFCFDGANLVDKIRQKVINMQDDPLLEEISDFINGSLKYLENDLPQDITSELFSAIFTFFNQFTQELMPIFDEILKKSRTNANYIYLTSLFLSYLTHVDLCLKMPDYQSFINDSISEICQQITNQSEKLIIFGHEIAPRFQNDFILNTVLSSTLTNANSSKLFNYIFYHYWRKSDKKFDLFLLEIIKSGLNTILPQTDSSNEEILEFLSKKDDQIFLKMSNESFSIIKSAIIYIKYESKVQIKGLDERTIFQLAAVISVLLRFLADFSLEIPSIKLYKFVNEIEIELFKNAVNSLKNNSSLTLIDHVLLNWPFLTLTQFVKLNQTFDFIDILIQQLINHEYKSDKFILINLYLDSINRIKPLNSKQLSNLFTFIFTNLKDQFYDHRSNFISKSFDLDYVDVEQINQQLNDFKSEEEAIQKIYFYEEICFNQPTINLSLSEILMKTIDKENQNQNGENLILIGKYLKRNYSIEKIEKIENLPLSIKLRASKLYPLNKKYKIEDIDKLLNDILSETDYLHCLLDVLFILMMEDQDNLYCYLSYLVSYSNSSFYIDNYFYIYSKEYVKYHDMFLKVTKELFSFINTKSILILRNRFMIKNFKISELGNSIVSKLFDSLKENPVCNYQAFVCLKSIACTVPILFNSNIQLIFDSILQPFNNLYLLFENNNKDDKSLLLTKTAYASLSFLLSTFQLSPVLDHFVKWLFINIENFSNSQIFGFLYILRCLSKANNVFYSFIPSDYKKHDIFNKVVGFLNRKITEGPNFEKHYKENIFGFLERVFYGFSTFNSYVICQNEMLSEKENKFTYFYSNIFSSFIEFNQFPIDAIDVSMIQFMSLVDDKSNYWINYDIDCREDLSDSIDFDTINELPRCELCDIPENIERLIIKPISIRMAKYLIMKPIWIYGTILFNNSNVYSKEGAELYIQTVENLLELQKQAQENPQDKENFDVETLNPIDYFTPLINQPEFIKSLVNQITFDNLDKDNLNLVFIRMAHYPIIAKKILESINLKINEIDDNPSILCNLIDLLSKISNDENIKENLFDLCLNNLINIVLTPKYRNDSNLLNKIAVYLEKINMKLPNRVIQIISFLILTKSKDSISNALKLCHCFDFKELNSVEDSILNIFDKIINQNCIDTELLSDILYYVPSIIKYRKFESFSLLTKEFENYHISKNKNQSFKLICFLLNAIAPYRFNSTTLSTVIDSSTLIPSFIKETGIEFWNIYEKNMKLINEGLSENPFLLDKELKFLLNYPEIIDFKIRSSYFKKKMKDRIDYDSELSFSVDFENLLETSFQCLHNLQPKEFLKKFRIKIVNSIVDDMGGVTRSWFTSLAKELFNPNYGIFDCSKNMRGYKPSCKSSIHPDHLEYFKFAGIFIARALIEGISIDAHLTSSFCKQILHRKTCLKDLEDIDDDMYRSSELILTNDADELYLTFAMNVDNFGEIKTIELKENGSEIPVTNENKSEFVNLRANYVLYTQIKEQINAFINGFDSLIPHEFLRFFTPSELDLLICGVPSIDVNDFEENMTYIEPYDEDTLVVRLFFEVIQNWENEDLAKLLLFMTGSSRVPINGFKEFTEITGHELKIGPGGKRENLPQSHTCFNELDLPEYQTKEELEAKLRKAMEYYNTFGTA